MQVKDGYRLSPGQARIASLGHQQPGTPLLAEGLFAIPSPVDEKALRERIASSIGRHEILRTRFLKPRGMNQFVQVIEPGAEFCLDFKKTGSVAPDRREEVLAEQRAEWRRRCPDPSQFPLAYFACLREEAGGSYLYLALPSLAADAASLQSLVAEIFAGAGQPAGGHEEEEALQYADIAEWKHALFEEEGAEQGLDYWREQLSGPLLEDRLPFAHSCAEDDRVSLQPLSHPFEIDLETEGVRRLAAQAGVGIEEVFLGCWFLLLQRYLEEPQVRVGITLDSRSQEELQGALGPLTQVLPFNMGRDPGENGASFLGRLSEELQTAAVWQQLFSWDRAQPEPAAASGRPYLANAFEFIPLQAAGEGGEGAPECLHLRCDTDCCDVKLSCLRGADSVRVRFYYNPLAADEADVSCLAQAYRHLLSQLCRHPDAPLQDLPLADPAALLEVYHRFNHQEDRPEGEPTLPLDLFEAQVAASPDRVALVCGDLSVTYGQLNRRAERWADVLLRRGLQGEEAVAVQLRRGADMATSLLAILKAGGAYLPLGRQEPAERMASMLGAGRCRLVLCEEASVFEAMDPQPESLTCSQLDQLSPEDSRRLGRLQSRPDHLAYILYTSGSTGQPKGVMVSHGGLANYLAWARQAYRTDHGQGSFVHSPLTFDFTVTSLWLPLLCGKTVWLADEEQGLEGMAALLEQPSGFDFVKLTPAHLRSLDYLGAQVHEASTTHVIVGGEALSRLDFKGWGSGQGVRIVNEYGPTETVVGCCVYALPLDHLDSLPGDSVPIGRPIPGTRIHLLCPEGQLTPPGLKGEIAIGGLGLARGYADRPDLTAQAFVPDAFGRQGDRTYLSGDLARLAGDGDLHFLGRNDDQVKVRGHRVELEEIASAARRHPALKEAFALAGVQLDGEASIILWVRPEDSQGLDEEDLQRHLKQRLPDFMLPARTVQIEEFPLTVQGKVDRKKLLAQLPPDEQPAGPIEAPGSREEEILLQVWKEVLPRQTFGVTDHFFRLGGDSIRSIRVVGLARKRGLSLELSDLAEHPTIRQLAQRIRGMGNDPGSNRSQPLAGLSEEDRKALGEEIEDAYPMTAMQEGMLFHSEWEEQAGVYHDIVGMHLKAPYSRPSLQGALRDCIAAHPILRTTFDLDNFSRPLQLVHKEPLLAFAEKSLADLPSEAQQEVLSRWMEEEKEQGFDWEKGPLVRFCVHLRWHDSFQFSMSFHHSLLDGWSTANLLVEIFSRYFSELGLAAQAPPGPPRSLFRDFVALEDQERNSQEAEKFWSDQLEDAPATLLTGLRADAEKPDLQQVVRVHCTFPEQVAQRALALSRQMEVPLKNVLLAAHLQVIGLLTGARDLVTGLVSNGRLVEEDGDRVLGLFLNTLPLRLSLSGRSLKELSRAAYRRETECARHRRYPLAEMDRRHQASDHFNTAFNFVNYHVYDDLERLEGVEVLDSDNFEQTSFTLLANFSYSEGSDSLSLFLDLDTSILTPWQTTFIQELYQRALRRITEAPESSSDPHLLLLEEEKEKLLENWSRGPGKARAQRLEALFQAQAIRRPDAAALVSAEETVTYAELNRRANRLARYLRSQGLGLDDVVGVRLDRSVDLIVSCLAVLKIGAAICCLDGDFPTRRLSFMVRDAAMKAVLTASSKSLDFVEDEACAVISLQDCRSAINGQAHGNLRTAGSPEHLCYLIYTSGSTGQPKGIAMPHRVLGELIDWQLKDFVSDAPARVLQYTALSFDVSFQEIFSTWAQGGTLVLVSQEVRGHPQQLWECLSRHEVERLFLPYAGLKQICDISSGNPQSRLALREVITAGEQLRITPTVRDFFHKHPRAVLWNQYGPAEAHVVTSGRLVKSCRHWPILPDIGDAVANAGVFVLDGQLNPLPAGVAGEIFLGGSLARSYFNRPSLTAERFLPSPYGIEGERLYRTGDQGRYLEDGRLEFLGRRDHQVKIMGYRVELEEVESVLSQHPAVAEAAVVAVEPRENEKSLAAFYVALEGQEAPKVQLREYLNSRLPAYMVPSFFSALDAFPRTAGGKIDRMSLTQRSLSEAGSAQPLVKPDSETEALMLEIWKRVLEVEEIGVEHDFFALGGHSLAATRIAVAIRKRLGIDLPLRTIFEARTIRALGQRVEAEMQAEASPESETADSLESLLKQAEDLPEEALRTLLESGLDAGQPEEQADGAASDQASHTGGRG